MSLTITQWHQRYLQQARWTQSIRHYLFEKCGIQHTNRLLDAGCGTGVLERDLSNQTKAWVYGLDIDFERLKFARDYAPDAHYCAGDCLSLPFARATFDVTVCHFLLLWIDRAQEAVEEMTRITKASGAILAIAEPDYGGRIDFPPDLAQIGAWQTGALEKQGANPMMGRQLGSIFTKAGLDNIEVGVLGGQWDRKSSAEEFELEWQVIESDLQDNEVFIQQADQFKAIEIASRKDQSRILFVPVFYAAGTVPG